VLFEVVKSGEIMLCILSISGIYYLYGFYFIVGDVILWKAVPSFAAAKKSR